MSNATSDIVRRLVKELQRYPASDAAIARMSELQQAIAATRVAVLPPSLFDTEPAQLTVVLEQLAESDDD